MKKILIFYSLITLLILFPAASARENYPQDSSSCPINPKEVALPTPLKEGAKEGTYPQRIISLGPDITEELYLLGAEDKIVGTTIYCNKPPQAKNKEKVGTIIEINLEKIVALKPDLVIATTLTDKAAKEKLSKLGLKVITLPLPKNFNQICEQFLALGKTVNKEKKAREIINAAKIRVEAIKQKAKNLSNPKVFIQVGTKPLFTITKDYFVNDFLYLAGGENIVHDSKIGLYSREKVVSDNPDIIIIITMEIEGKKEKETWERYESINAVKNKRIYVLDPYKFCSPTPISFADGLEEIYNILHPQKI